MNAAEVRAALHGRWPDERHLHLEEACLNSYRQGNKIDVLVIDQWHSGSIGPDRRNRRHASDAVEVKVSYADWTKEWRRTSWVITESEGGARSQAYQSTPSKWALARFSNPSVEKVVTVDTSKNRAWRQCTHRFWIAAPADLAERIAADVADKPELAGWGVLGVSPTSGLVIVMAKPTVNKTPKEWGADMWLGLLRTAADSGPNALLRAYERGRREGRAA